MYLIVHRAALRGRKGSRRRAEKQLLQYLQGLMLALSRGHREDAGNQWSVITCILVVASTVLANEWDMEWWQKERSQDFWSYQLVQKIRYLFKFDILSLVCLLGINVVRFVMCVHSSGKNWGWICKIVGHLLESKVKLYQLQHLSSLQPQYMVMKA